MIQVHQVKRTLISAKCHNSSFRDHGPQDIVRTDTEWPSSHQHANRRQFAVPRPSATKKSQRKNSNFVAV